MTINQILESANILADESIDYDEMFTFLVHAISKVNMEASMLLPIPDNGDGDKDYYIAREVVFADANNPTKEELIREGHFKSANQMFINNILIQYIHYAVKVQDGSQYEFQNSYEEWRKNLGTFIGRFKEYIDPIYLTENVDLDGKGTTRNYGAGIFEVEHQVFSDDMLWGKSPTAGAGYVSGGRSYSKNPYGK